MALSRTDAQPDFFPHLDEVKPVGVFYFPRTTSTPEEQLNALDTTITHIRTINTVLEKHKISALSAPRYDPLIRWLASLEFGLRSEKDKLLMLNPAAPEPMQDSMQASNAR